MGVDPIWAAERPVWFPDEFGWVVGYSHRGVPTQTSTVRNPFGGNMAIRVEALQAIGGFRSGIGRVGTRPVGGEETDVCIRLLRARPTTLVVFEPSARIGHHIPASRTTLRYFVARCYHEGISKAQLAAYSGASPSALGGAADVRHVVPDAVSHGVQTALRGDVASGLGKAGAGWRASASSASAICASRSRAGWAVSEAHALRWKAGAVVAAAGIAHAAPAFTSRSALLRRAFGVRDRLDDPGDARAFDNGPHPQGTRRCSTRWLARVPRPRSSSWASTSGAARISSARSLRPDTPSACTATGTGTCSP